MKNRERQLETGVKIVTVACPVWLALGITLFALMFGWNVWVASVLLILAAGQAALMLFVRYLLVRGEKKLEEAAEEIKRLTTDNEYLKLSLDEGEDELSLLNEHQALLAEAQLSGSAVSEEDDDRVFQGFGFSPEDLIKYFGKKKSRSSGSAVYRVISTLENRVRELERLNEDLQKHAGKPERKSGNT